MTLSSFRDDFERLVQFKKAIDHDSTDRANNVPSSQKQCGLCLSFGMKLSRSHIVPNSVLKIAYPSGVYHFQRGMDVGTKKLTATQFGFCAPNCEVGILQNGEASVTKLCQAYFTNGRDRPLEVRYDEYLFEGLAGIAYRGLLEYNDHDKAMPETSLKFLHSLRMVTLGSKDLATIVKVRIFVIGVNVSTSNKENYDPIQEQFYLRDVNSLVPFITYRDSFDNIIGTFQVFILRFLGLFFLVIPGDQMANLSVSNIAGSESSSDVHEVHAAPGAISLPDPTERVTPQILKTLFRHYTDRFLSVVLSNVGTENFRTKFDRVVIEVDKSPGMWIFRFPQFIRFSLDTGRPIFPAGMKARIIHQSTDENNNECMVYDLGNARPPNQRYWLTVETPAKETAPHTKLSWFLYLDISMKVMTTPCVQETSSDFYKLYPPSALAKAAAAFAQYLID